MSGAIDFNQEILAGNVLVREAAQSQNFQAGVSGWQLAANGDAELNTVTVRGKVITGPTGSKHLEINGSDAPNGIAFYTGNAAETFPGVIQPDADTDYLYTTFSSPLASGQAGSSLSLATSHNGVNNDSAQLGSQDVLVSGSKTASLTGPTIGATGINTAYYLNTDGTGQYADIIAPRIFLRDNANGPNDNGLVVIGKNIDVISNPGWLNAASAGGTSNSWADIAGARFGYYKDATGRVSVRGKMISGTAVGIITLPVGYRPTSNLDFTMRGGTTVCAVSVGTNGAITVTANFAAAAASGINLDCITFPTA